MAEQHKSGVESQGGDQEKDDANAVVRRPKSKWVRTSGRSKVRGAEHQISGTVVQEKVEVKLPSDDAQGTEQTASPTVRSMAVAPGERFHPLRLPLTPLRELVEHKH